MLLSSGWDKIEVSTLSLMWVKHVQENECRGKKSAQELFLDFSILCWKNGISRLECAQSREEGLHTMS